MKPKFKRGDELIRLREDGIVIINRITSRYYYTIYEPGAGEYMTYANFVWFEQHHKMTETSIVDRILAKYNK